jgi:hypothetical protein
MGDKYQPSSRDLMLIAALSILLEDPKTPNEISKWIKSKLLQLEGSERIQ